MGVQNFSLSIGPNYSTQGRTDGILIHEDMDGGYGVRDIRLVWSTEFGNDWNESWTIAISARGTIKGAPAGAGAWHDYRGTFTAAQCNENKPYSGSRTWWNHSLDIGSFLTDFAGGSWLFGRRKYDSIDLRITCQSKYRAGMVYEGNTHSDLATLDCSIGYCPVYNLTGAEYTAEGKLAITYTTNWTRTDDRYYCQTLNSVDGGACTVDGRPLFNQAPTGTVTANGRIEIDDSYLTQHVIGKSIYLNIALNAVYRPIAMEFASMSGTVTVKDERKCSTPKLTVVGQGEEISIKVTDTNDKDVSFEYAVVKMVDSEYSNDTITVANGGTAVFRSAPFGKTLYFEAIGYTAAGAVSGVSNRVSAHSSGRDDAIIVSTEGASVALTKFLSGNDRGISISAEPVADVVKIAGKSRQSAYYGKGRTAKLSLSAVIEPDEYDVLLAMCEQGDMTLRDPLGHRYKIVPSVDITSKTPELYTVDISGSEVGG